jgi:hypothetical protein
MDREELLAMIRGTTRAIRSYGMEAGGKAKEDQGLINAARDLIYESSVTFLPSGNPCARCNGSGVEPTP